MYKSKVWLHKTAKELEKNEGSYNIHYTFIDKPKPGQILNVTSDMTEDLQDDFVWSKDYGHGNYIIQSAKEMFDPKVNDGFSFCVMVIKVQIKDR